MKQDLTSITEVPMDILMKINLVFFSVPANRKINHSLMCAISTYGVISFEIRQGAFNSDSFIHFINNHLVPYFTQNRNAVLIMENASFHKSAQVLLFFAEKCITVKFLPPYSPQLNPIEEFFSMLKSNFCRLRSENS